MGQVLHTARFRSEAVTQHPDFHARRADVCREFQISNSTLYRWERVGVIWPYDDEHPDGQYIRLPSGRARYSLARLRLLHVHGT